MVALSLHSIVPVRSDAREGAEQNTQMLFGELAQVLEEQDRWTRIRLDSDGQEGWVDTKMIAPIAGDDLKAYKAALKKAATVTFPMTYAVSENNGQTIPLTAGTRLAKYQDGRFEVLGVGFRIDPSMVLTGPLVLNQENLLKTVRFFINVPYLWGGKNALGMDCSGFTQTVMGLFGKQLKRNASEQVTQGRTIKDLPHAQAGDLAFFDHEDGKISHVGLLIDSQRIIHCSGRVKVEKIDEKGIFNAETGEYSHHLVSIRRV